MRIGSGSGAGGKRHHERRAAAGGVADVDRPVVRVHHALDDREAEAGAGAAALAPALAAPEALEQAARAPRRRCRGRGRARSSVDRRRSRRRPTTSIGVPRGRVHERVAQQVGEHLAQLQRVAETIDGARRRSARSRARAPRARASCDGVARERGEVDRLAARARACSSRRASVSRSSTSTPMRSDSSSIRRIAFSVSSGSRGRAHAEQLGVAADRGERRAQLVRGVGEEAAQALFARRARGERLLEPVEHRVEREPEPADLGASGSRG